MTRRTIISFSLIMACFSILFLRIASIATNSKLLETANRQSSYTLSFNTTRGMIYDTNMVPMVGEEQEYIASVLPLPENLNELSKTQDLFKTDSFDTHLEKAKPFLIKSKKKELNIPFVNVFSIPKRNSNNTLAPHIIGYVDQTKTNGVTGIEKAFNEELNKNSGQSTITYTVDGIRNTLFDEEANINYSRILYDGVVLTIDSNIQKIIEETGEKYIQKGAIVVMDPYNGELKGVASFPSYQVENLTAALDDEEKKPLINRAFYPYSVGSTFKIATTAAALTQNIPTSTIYPCYGKIKVKDVEFRCHSRYGHGKIDMKEAMEVSCNPYFIQLAMDFDKEYLLNMAKDLSFGKGTVLAPGISTHKGYIPSMNDLFNPAEVANLSFGQGILTATPVQVGQMLSAVLNEGNTISPVLVKGLTEDGKTIKPINEETSPIKAMSVKIASIIKSFLVSSVMEVKNQNARPQFVSAGGKTGTAQTGHNNENGEEILQGWFAGFLPAEQPEYVVVVLSEDSTSGNNNASPVFAEIADKITNPEAFEEVIKFPR